MSLILHTSVLKKRTWIVEPKCRYCKIRKYIVGRPLRVDLIVLGYFKNSDLGVAQLNGGQVGVRGVVP